MRGPGLAAFLASIAVLAMPAAAQVRMEVDGSLVASGAPGSFQATTTVLRDSDGVPGVSVTESRVDVGLGVVVQFFEVAVDSPRLRPIRIAAVPQRGRVVVRDAGQGRRAARVRTGLGDVVVAPPARAVAARPSSRGTGRGPMAYQRIESLSHRAPGEREIVTVEVQAPGDYLFAFASGPGDHLAGFARSFGTVWSPRGPLRADSDDDSPRQGHPQSVLLPQLPYTLGIGMRTPWKVWLNGRDPSARVDLLWLAHRLLAAQDAHGLWRYDQQNAFLASSFDLPMQKGFHDDRTTATAVRLLLAANSVASDERFVASARRAADAYLQRFPRLRVDAKRSIPFAYLSPTAPEHATIVAFNHTYEAVLMLLEAGRTLGEPRYVEAGLDLLSGLERLGRPNMKDGYFWYGAVPGTLGVELHARDASGKVFASIGRPAPAIPGGKWNRISHDFDAPEGAVDVQVRVYRGTPARGGALVRNVSVVVGDREVFRHRLDTTERLVASGVATGDIVEAGGESSRALRVGRFDDERPFGFLLGPFALDSNARVRVTLETAEAGPLVNLWGPSPYQDLEVIELEQIRAALDALTPPRQVDWIDDALEAAGRWARDDTAVHPATGKTLAEMTQPLGFNPNVFARVSPFFFGRLAGAEGRGIELPRLAPPRLEWDDGHAIQPSVAAIGDVVYLRGVKLVEDGALRVHVDPERAVSFAASPHYSIFADGRIRDVQCGAESVCTWTIDELRAGDRVRLCARTEGQADLEDLNAPNLAIVQRGNRCAELRAESSTTAVVSVRSEQAMP